MLNPQPGSPDQDALGLITIYPRPDEPASFPLPITHRPQPPPSMPPFFQGSSSASTAAFSIQEHLTIRYGGCQHNCKTNRITVYPFIHKRVNRYKRGVGLGLSYSPFCSCYFFSSLTIKWIPGIILSNGSKITYQYSNIY